MSRRSTEFDHIHVVQKSHPIRSQPFRTAPLVPTMTSSQNFLCNIPLVIRAQWNRAAFLGDDEKADIQLQISHSGLNIR